MEEAIVEYQEKRENLGSYRDFLSKKLDERIANEVAERERDEVENFDLVFKRFLGDVKVWRETVDNYFDLQMNHEEYQPVENADRETDSTTSEKSNVVMAWQLDRDRAEAGTSSGNSNTKTGKKRNASSQTTWKPHIKPYKIPRKVPHTRLSQPEKLSLSAVICQPNIVPDPVVNESSNSSDDCVITGEYKIAVSEVSVAVEKALEVVKATKEEDRKRDKPRAEAKSNVANAEPVPSGSNTKSIVELGLQDPAPNRVADIADNLLPTRRGAFEIIAEFPREILIKATLDPTRPRRWEKIHLSAKCSYNWIGETAVRNFLNPRTEAGPVNELRVEDWINHQMMTVRDIKYWVRPEIAIGGIVFRRKFYVVPKKHTMFFAPMRVQLGKNFIREYVKNIDEHRREITLIKDQVREFCRYEPRRSANIYDFSRRDRAISYGAHNVR